MKKKILAAVLAFALMIQYTASSLITVNAIDSTDDIETEIVPNEPNEAEIVVEDEPRIVIEEDVENNEVNEEVENNPEVTSEETTSQKQTRASKTATATINIVGDSYGDVYYNDNGTKVKVENGQQIIVSSKQTLEVSPTDGYEVKVTISNMLYCSYNPDKLTVTLNTSSLFDVSYSVTITFTPKTSTFSYDVGDNGALYQLKDEVKVTAPTTVNVLDKNTTFVAEPADGYELDTVTVTVNGETVSVTNNTFTVTNESNAEIRVTFKAASKQTLTLNQTGEGTVKLNDTKISNDTTYNLKSTDKITFEAKDGYTLTSIKLNDESIDVNNEIDLSTYNLNDEGNTLEVVFTANTIALNDNVYTINYMEGEDKFESLEDLSSELISALVDKTHSIPTLDENATISIYYKAGTKVTSIIPYKTEDVWEEITNTITTLSIHKFGNNDTETIYFECNGVKSDEVTIEFIAVKKEISSITLKDNLSMTYTTNAKDLESVLFNGIDFENSNLPDGLTIDDFNYYYTCDIAALISNELSAGALDSVLGSMDLTRKVSTDVSTLGELLESDSSLSILNTLLSSQKDKLSSIILTPNVGTCDVKVEFKGNKEYASTSTTGIITITKAKATVKVNSKSIKYGQEIPSSLVTVTPSNVKTLTVYAGINGDAEGFVSIDLPDSIATSVIESLGSFTLGEITDILEKLNIVVDSEELEQLLSVLPDEVKNMKVSLGKQPTDAGIYVVGAITVDGNYETAYSAGMLTIAPETTNVSLKFNETLPSTTILKYAEAQTFTFGGYATQNDVNIDANVKALYVGTTFDGEVKSSSTPITTPGVYTETIYILGGNYFATPIVRAYTVTRESSTIVVNTEDKVYDGNSISITGVVKDSSDNVIENAEIQYTYIKLNGLNSEKQEGLPTDAGKYLVFALYTGDSTHGVASTSLTVTIEKAKTSIEVLNAENNTIEATYNGEKVEADVNILPEFSFEVPYTITYSDSNGELETAPINAGEYTYTVTVESTDNYEGSKVEGKIIIAKADVNITITNSELEKTYDGTALKINATALPNYVTDQDTESLDYTVAYYDENNNKLDNAPVNAGTYTYIINVNETSNTNAATTEGTITISPREITVVVDNATKTISDDDPTFTYTVNGELVSNDNAEDIISIERTQGEEIGTYEIKATSKSNNYKIVSQNGTLTINDYALADYTEVDKAIANVPSDLSGYTSASVTALQNALNAVDRNLKFNKQEIVDNYAKAIQTAINNLVKKGSTELSVNNQSFNFGNVSVSDNELKNIEEGMPTEVKTKIEAAKNEGKNISIEVVVTESTNATDKQFIDQYVETLKTNTLDVTVSQYLDISIVVKVDDEVIGTITSLDKDISISITLSESNDSTVVRVHEETVNQLDATLKNNVLTFKTNQFSTFGIINYSEIQDIANDANKPTDTDKDDTIANDANKPTDTDKDDTIVNDVDNTTTDKTIEVSDEESVTTTTTKEEITKEKSTQQSQKTKTADNTNTGMYSMICLLALVVLGFVVKRKELKK